MNLRLSILLVAVLVIVGGAFLVIRLTSSEETVSRRPWLYRIDQQSIAHLTVNHGGLTVDYDKPPGGPDWLIIGSPSIPVFIPKWGGTTLLVSGPMVSSEVTENVEDLANFGLDPPSTVLDIIDRAGNSFEVLLGDVTPDTKNQYAQLKGESALFTLPVSWGDVMNRLVNKPPYLQMFQLEEKGVIFIEVTSDGNTVGYRKDLSSGEWSIEGEPPVPVSQDGWDGIPFLISGPRVDKRISFTFDNPAQYGLEPPKTRVRIREASGQPTEFLLGDAIGDGKYQYALVVGEPELFAMLNGLANRITSLAIDPPSSLDTQDDEPGPR